MNRTVAGLDVLTVSQISLVSTGPFNTPLVGKFKWPASHPAYEAPTSPTAGLAGFYDSYVPPGDPRKGMEVVYKLASLADPPLYFPLSPASVAAYKSRAKLLLESAEKYASWSENVDKTV